jgi:hypothetical protein
MGSLTEIMELLSGDDQYRLAVLQADLKAKRDRYQTDSFLASIDLVYEFITHKRDGLHLRSFASGVVFGRGYLIIHSGRLKDPMGRSRSCVNLWMKEIGTGTNCAYAAFVAQQILSGILPELRRSSFGHREWTLRVLKPDRAIEFVTATPPTIPARFDALALGRGRPEPEAELPPEEVAEGALGLEAIAHGLVNELSWPKFGRLHKIGMESGLGVLFEGSVSPRAIVDIVMITDRTVHLDDELEC